MMWPKRRATPWVPTFSAGFALAALLFWLPDKQPPAIAAQPTLAPVLRADTFARVASDRERSVVFLHTVTGASQSPSPEQPTLIEPIQESLGSGVVIDATGLILTNAHVVDGVDAVHVRTADGEDIDAQVVGTDPDNDIALLRAADARGLRQAPLGDSDKVRAGDLVVAIGNPLGLHHTVTTGVISAKARGLDDTGIEFLQTDAAVNPGSSGGPLLNLNGEVVGLTTAILSKYGENVGLNFAIPINAVKAVLPQLRTGSVTHGWLGVATRSLTPTGARALGITGGGLLVTELAPEGPALRAGVRLGDVLVGIGVPPAITPARDIHRRVRDAAPGSTQRAASQQVVRRQRPVDPREGVIVEGIQAAEVRAHLAHLHQEAARQRWKRDVSFLDLDALFTNGEEEVGSRVRIDNRLKAPFALLEGRKRRTSGEEDDGRGCDDMTGKRTEHSHRR